MPLSALFSKDPANHWTGLDYTHLSRDGVGWKGAWEWGSHSTDESVPGDPRPLGFLANMYLLPLTPIPFSYLEGYRKKLGQ